MSYHNRRPDECTLCELINLLYPKYKSDNAKASLLILAHLELDHHIGVEVETVR